MTLVPSLLRGPGHGCLLAAILSLAALVTVTPAQAQTNAPGSNPAPAARPGAAKANNGNQETKPTVLRSEAAKPDDTKSGEAKPEGTKSESERSKANESKPEVAKAEAKPAVQRFDIDEFRVEGAENLPQIEVEEAVYPFMGPNRSLEDVEKARTALEKAYHDKGFQTVGVAIPQQDALRGFIVLKVTENRVGRLRVKGSRYYDLNNIKHKANSVHEGALPNFKDVTKDIVSLNQWPDRRVTPSLRAGVAPGTVDVDLNVEDKHPLHGSVELNNRQSPNTTNQRFNVTARYENLWQLGHSITASYQVSPLRRTDASVLSGSYLARTDLDWLNLLLYGLKSRSSVATVGGANVIGPGRVIGARAVITLPTKGSFFHTVSVGADYKDFKQTLDLGSDSFSSPVVYVPLVATYNASLQGEGRLSQLSATLTAGLRGIGSEPEEFDAKRFKAKPNFVHLRGDISHTHDLPGGHQLFAKVQGQITDQPLVSSEQFSVGGFDTVRGYLESESVGDFGAVGTVELRSMNLAPFFEQKLDNPTGEPTKFNVLSDWRLFAFFDAGRTKIHDPLIEQQRTFDLASYGFGTRLRVLTYLNGLVFVGIPLIGQQVSVANSPRWSFRLWGEF